MSTEDKTLEARKVQALESIGVSIKLIASVALLLTPLAFIKLLQKHGFNVQLANGDA